MLRLGSSIHFSAANFDIDGGGAVSLRRPLVYARVWVIMKMKDCEVSFNATFKNIPIIFVSFEKIVYFIYQFNHHYQSMLCLRFLHCTRLWEVVSIRVPYFIGNSINKFEITLICSISQASRCCLDLTSFS